ncbi:MAG TPA: ubiquinol-cytochrome c reductase iron-sulfur subunit [Bryobacteraceae bacterium]|jgi:menaquinol-cytochrome c reductase iron-sulfur subunit|nr:ubiquinol-cytochrome c reductase iron-sulfur subunit [Bryobacteraceae bacterium]
MNEEEGIGRRRFQLTSIYALGAAIATALGIPAFSYLLVPQKRRRSGEWVDVADLSKLTVGTPEEVVFRRERVDGWKVTSEKTTAWIIKQPDGQAVALAPQCTHLGCAYRWDEQDGNFLCPCHNSRFSKDGSVLSGPAPRPLDRYAVRTEGARLLIGTILPVKAS